MNIAAQPGPALPGVARLPPTVPGFPRLRPAAPGFAYALATTRSRPCSLAL